jgi:uncharacterized protein (DUF488 family)
LRAASDFTAYTIGYQATSVEAFVASLRAQHIAHLIDIREVALSRKKGFSKTALSGHLQEAGIRYSHIRALGCPKLIRDQYRADGNWEHYARGFTAYLGSQSTAIRDLVRTIEAERCCLMCFEADHTVCHRTLVARELGGTVVHLTARDS